MKPLLHAKASVRKHGGIVEDYLAIHEWFDQTKAHVPDMRHRALLHNSWGIYLAQSVFGFYLTNRDECHVSTRDVGEEHVLEDLGRIPTVQDYLVGMPLYHWLGGPRRRRTVVVDERRVD